MKKYYCIALYIVFAAIGCIIPFYTAYLNQEIGLDLDEIGKIISIGSLLAIILQPNFAVRFSKAENKKK